MLNKIINGNEKKIAIDERINDVDYNTNWFTLESDYSGTVGSYNRASKRNGVVSAFIEFTTTVNIPSWTDFGIIPWRATGEFFFMLTNIDTKEMCKVYILANKIKSTSAIPAGHYVGNIVYFTVN